MAYLSPKKTLTVKLFVLRFLDMQNIAYTTAYHVATCEKQGITRARANKNPLFMGVSAVLFPNNLCRQYVMTS